ncbi:MULTISPECIES: cysteine desulfurase family protein [Tenacibaculum]|uniref:cysteine desulfurase family protein n=1 Tax=Tenacibaculum TaxID=104267 RepID=UPI001F0B3AE4|nr:MULTISPECIES: cysteine desulfurase family protein [Tenacibaculum]MCH3882629.1 cysteine desulfurase [Tenacibaculum aquimarinum]MDO6600676.1 cysteine desulfurase family protein [Tenacibaculum sp. 1_MG-2023]
MKTIFLDNASTTPMYSEVISVMQQSMQENFGNPSSTHQFGRKAKSSIENARKNIAKHFNISSSQLVFTAGGTEADNLILINAVANLEVTRIITTKIEHHAVLHTVEHLQKENNIKVLFVNVDEFGTVDLNHLEELLASSPEKTLVSLMMVNNEIGNILPVDEVSEICKKYNAFFHSDTVQAIGHYKIDLQKTPIDFITASAHKFHGPKGVGFMYFKKGLGIKPMLHGGEQEKGARSSTENVHAILGMDKALEIGISNLDADSKYISDLKEYFIAELKILSDKITFNGLSLDLVKSSYTILNVRFPVENKMFLFNLDLAGIAVSGGSACQSGSNKGSHVLQAFLADEDAKKTSVRFSFSKFTTKADLEYCIQKLKLILKID